MPEVTKTPSTNGNHASPETPAVEVFAVYGVEPEIQAYAMAKYSRSSLSMKESLKEISQQKAEKFPQHVLLSVWTSFHRRSGACGSRHREAVDFGRHFRRR